MEELTSTSGQWLGSGVNVTAVIYTDGKSNWLFLELTDEEREREFVRENYGADPDAEQSIDYTKEYCIKFGKRKLPADLKSAAAAASLLIKEEFADGHCFIYDELFGHIEGC